MALKQQQRTRWNGNQGYKDGLNTEGTLPTPQNTKWSYLKVSLGAYIPTPPTPPPPRGPCHSLRASSLGCSGGRAGKGRRACNHSLEFEYLHLKSWFEMLIGGDDVSNDVITPGTCFSMLVNISQSFMLRTDWRKSDSSVNREQQGNWSWNSHSRDVVASSPSFLPAPLPPPPECPGKLARRLALSLSWSLMLLVDSFRTH